MKLLHDLSIGNRIAITLAIVLAILLGLALYGYLTGGWEEDEETAPFRLMSTQSRAVELPVCMNEEMRERIRAVMYDALDEALKNHIVHAFEVWLKDAAGQPGRAQTGVHNGIKAYLNARKGAAEWMPPPCSG